MAIVARYVCMEATIVQGLHSALHDGAARCRESCSSLEAMVSSSKVVATTIVIPNFKHSWACLGGAKSRRPKRP